MKIRHRQSTKTLITNGFDQLNSRMDKLQMTESQTQTDVDNATTVVTGLLSDLATQTASILNDLNTLVNSSGTTVNTSALDSVVSQVQEMQDNLDSAVTSLNTLAAPPVATTTPVTPAAPTAVISEKADVAPHTAPELSNPVGNRGASLMGVAPVAIAPPADVPPAAPADLSTSERPPAAMAASSRSRASSLIDDAVNALKALGEEIK